MFPDAREVRLGPDERAELEARLRAPTSEQRHVFRARIVLMAAEGLSTRAIARDLGTMPRTVSHWRIFLIRSKYLSWKIYKKFYAANQHRLPQPLQQLKLQWGVRTRNTKWTLVPD